MSKASSKTSQQGINIGMVEIQTPANKEDKESHRPPEHQREDIVSLQDKVYNSNHNSHRSTKQNNIRSKSSQS